MPTASDEQRDKMREYFGDAIDDGGPMKYLREQGYTLTRGGIYSKPSPDHKMTDKEADCVYFLCDEWDYGFEG